LPGVALVEHDAAGPEIQVRARAFANWRMSIVWPFMAASQEMADGRLAPIYPARDLRIFHAA
jgi:hypothetical protein